MEKVVKIFFSAFIPAIVACVNNNAPPQDQIEIKQRLIPINNYLTEKDKDIIEHYIRRHDRRMKPDSGGYYYEIFESGSLPFASSGDAVTFDCRISLLNGVVLYSSDEYGPKTMIVDADEEIKGMHLAIKHLGKDGRGSFIFLPGLAYGLQGDPVGIPPRAVLLYDVTVTDVR